MQDGFYVFTRRFHTYHSCLYQIDDIFTGSRSERPIFGARDFQVVFIINARFNCTSFQRVLHRFVKLFCTLGVQWCGRPFAGWCWCWKSLVVSCCRRAKSVFWKDVGFICCCFVLYHCMTSTVMFGWRHEVIFQQKYWRTPLAMFSFMMITYDTVSPWSQSLGMTWPS